MKEGFHPEHLSDYIADHIRGSIGIGAYPSKLPSMTELSKQLGTTRTTVGQALKTLEAEGLVHVRHGLGTFLTDSSESMRREIVTREAMATTTEGTNTTPIRTAKDLQQTQFGKVVQAQSERGIDYSAEFKRDEGGEITTFEGENTAWIAQLFRFDKSGNLDGVMVEKRFLEKKPADQREAADLFRKASLQTEILPVYRIVLKREADGKFGIQNITTNDPTRNATWTKEFNSGRQPASLK
jgi:DNA-binding transcriptional regulator YhcF (GntR family)